MSPAKSSDRSCLHSISALYLGTHRAMRLYYSAVIYRTYRILSYFMQNMMTIEMHNAQLWIYVYIYSRHICIQ